MAVAMLVFFVASQKQEQQKSTITLHVVSVVFMEPYRKANLGNNCSFEALARGDHRAHCAISFRTKVEGTLREVTTPTARLGWIYHSQSFDLVMKILNYHITESTCRVHINSLTNFRQ